LDVVVEPERKTHVLTDVDVVVVGGGPAGIGAALASARNGADTTLIERCGSLGGMSTLGLMCVVVPPMLGVTKEIFDRLRNMGYAVDYEDRWPKGMTSNALAHFSAWEGLGLTVFDPEAFRIVVNEMMEEEGVRLLFHSQFVDTIVEDGAIRAALLENVSGRQAIKGKVFVDATGTGDVVARSGAPYVEARDATGVPMPMTLMYKMGGVDFEKLLEHQKKDPELAKLIAEAKAKGELPYYRPKKSVEEMKGHYDAVYTGHPRLEMSPLVFRDEMLVWGGPVPHEWGLDGTKVEDLTRAEVNVRKQIWAEVNFLKKYVPGFENAFLSTVSSYMGVREKRHPVGEHVLTFDDVKSGRKFDDATLRLNPDPGAIILGLPTTLSFDLPYRCLLPKKIDNLLLAGDNISADHGAFLHIRNVVKAMNIGQVAGTAAALSAKKRVKPKDLDYPTLRTKLVKQGLLPR